MPEPRLLPLTAAQAGLLVEAPDEGPDPYVAQLHVDLEGAVEPDRVAAACRTALDKVPNLRAAVDATSARTPVLVLGQPGPTEWTVVDLRGGGDVDVETRRLRAAPMDVAAGDLVRFALLRVPDGARLVLTFHHLLLDGWSAGLLLQLVLRCLVAGDAVPSPPPVARLLRWQAAHRPDDDAWSAVLDGARPGAVTTSLAPVGRADRGADQGADRGGDGDHEWGAEQVPLAVGADETVRAVARSAGTTVATVLQAAWGVTLARTFGRSDVLFAVVDSGRAAPVDGVDRMIGMLVVTTVRRVRAGGTVDEALAALARDVAATATAVPLSLGAVGERLDADPAADTLVVVDNQAELFATGSVPGGVRITGVGGVQRSGFPVVLHVTTSPDLRLEIQYDRAAVGADAARMLAQQVADAVADLATPGAPCLRRGSGPASPTSPEDRTDQAPAPLRRVLEIARAAPDRPAVVDAAGTMSYGRLVARAARVAGRLRAEGVTTGSVVAVCLDRSAELAATLLGVRWAGAAYLAVDPQQPEGRRRALVRRTGCAVVVCDATTVGDDLGAPTLVVADDAPAAPEPRGVPDLAYVVHTSGSTGATKGVVVPDAALAAQLAWLGTELATGPGDRVLWRTSVAFDASVWELWLPLVTGAVVVAAGADEGADPEALRRLLGEVTVAQLVPTLLGPVVDDGSWSFPEGLRVLAVGGEVLSPSLARHLVHLDGCRVVNLYGPTETTVQVAAHDVAARDVAAGVVPVGEAVPGTGLHVLSDELVEVPDHVVGELWVTGAQLAVGYGQDPAGTAATFVAAPMGPPGTRAYRTGDLAWRGPRGIVVVGRRDRQVKIRGYRVDLGEIEEAAAQVPGVRRCVALVREAASGSRQVAAVAEVAAPRAGQETTLDEPALRTALADVLPAPLVPDLIVLTDALPTLPSGKPDPAGAAETVEAAAARRATGGDAAPGGAADDAVVAVQRAVGHVLDLPDVGPDDDVLVLGMDSVTSLGVVARLRRDGLAVAPRDVHGLRTPRAIAAAARLVDDAPDDDGTGRFPVPPFVAEQLGRGADRSFQVAVVRVPGEVDGDSLRRLANGLVATHPMLRARLVRSDDGPWLEVGTDPAPGASVEVHDAGLPAVGEVLADQVEEAARGLDPASGRMLALRAVRGERETLLAVVVHHLAVDTVSMQVLLDDLRDAWHDGGASLVPPVTSYRTWARAVQRRVAGLTVEEPSSPGETRTPDPLAHDDGPAGRRTDQLPDGLARRALAQDDVETERLVLAATALALHRVALADGRGTLRTVALEVEAHGRDLFAAAGDPDESLDVSRTVGWFTRSRVLHVDTSGLRLGDGWSRPEDLVELLDRVARADTDEEPLRDEVRRARDGGLGGHVLVNYLGAVTSPAADAHWRPLVASGHDAFPTPGPDLLPVTHPLTLDVLQVREPERARVTLDWGWQAGVAATAVTRAWAAALDDLCTALTDHGVDDDPDTWWFDGAREPVPSWEAPR